MTENDKIDQQAAQWVAREDRGLASGENATLAAWLDEAVGNRVAYLRLRNSWAHSARLAALRNSPRFSDRSLAHLFFSRFAAGAAAILALTAIGIAAFFFLHHGETVYTADIGQHPTLQLPDGTRIELNTDSQVRTDMTRASRMVTLERGEAYFDVVHDDARPFVVLAGNRRITDLGTKFSVRRDGDNVRVVVTEGHVRVEVINPPAPVAPVFADGGNVVVAKAEETLVATKSAQDLAEDLSWRSGTLIFNQETLADAAEEFNRYNRRHIVVKGYARQIRIGGSFRSDNIDVFASLVRNALGLKVEKEPDQITISQ